MYNDKLTIEELLALGSQGASISNEKYHQLPGVSGSALSLMEESNRHFDNKKLFSMGDQAHFALGSFVHELVLEPHLSSSYVQMPSFDGRTTVGKADKAAWLAQNQNKIVISSEDYDKATRMAENVWAICGDTLDNSICERSLFAEFAPGVIIKCRIDAQCGTDDYDLKTMTPKNGMSEYELRTHAEKYGYYKSAALRNVVRQSLGLITGDSFLIFVSTSPGQMVKVRRIPRQIITAEMSKVRLMLSGYADYLKYGDLENDVRDLQVYEQRLGAIP